MEAGLNTSRSAFLAPQAPLGALDLVGLEGLGGQDLRRSQPLPPTRREQPSYLMGVTAEVVDAPRLLLTVMFWGFVSLKNDPAYWPLPTVKSAPVQF
jgi:hypothetical protein